VVHAGLVERCAVDVGAGGQSDFSQQHAIAAESGAFYFYRAGDDVSQLDLRAVEVYLQAQAGSIVLAFRPRHVITGAHLRLGSGGAIQC
jgi:hypothetical protein